MDNEGHDTGAKCVKERESRGREGRDLQERLPSQRPRMHVGLAVMGKMAGLAGGRDASCRLAGELGKCPPRRVWYDSPLTCVRASYAHRKLIQGWWWYRRLSSIVYGKLLRNVAGVGGLPSERKEAGSFTVFDVDLDFRIHAAYLPWMH